MNFKTPTDLWVVGRHGGNLYLTISATKFAIISVVEIVFSIGVAGVAGVAGVIGVFCTERRVLEFFGVGTVVAGVLTWREEGGKQI